MKNIHITQHHSDCVRCDDVKAVSYFAFKRKKKFPIYKFHCVNGVERNHLNLALKNCLCAKLKFLKKKQILENQLKLAKVSSAWRKQKSRHRKSWNVFASFLACPSIASSEFIHSIQSQSYHYNGIKADTLIVKKLLLICHKNINCWTGSGNGARCPLSSSLLWISNKTQAPSLIHLSHPYVFEYLTIFPFATHDRNAKQKKRLRLEAAPRPTEKGARNFWSTSSILWFYVFNMTLL